MYTIANVIYGFSIKEDVINADTEDDSIEAKIARLIEMNSKENQNGFLKYYSGSNYFNPIAFGVKLCQFNECDDVKINNLKLTANLNDIDRFDKYFNNLPKEIQDYFKNEKAESFILWSTS